MATNIHIGGMDERKSFSLAHICTVSIIVVLLQIILVPNIAINDIAPDLVLLGVVIVARKNGPAASCLTGFVCGLLYDLMNSGPLGVMAFMLALVGYVLAQFQSQANDYGAAMNPQGNGVWVDLALFLAAALVVELGYGLALSLTGYDVSFGSSFIFRILPSLLYDTVCAAIVFGIRNLVVGHDQQKPTSRIRR
jgi:rod shape-determining protein MreD